MLRTLVTGPDRLDFMVSLVVGWGTTHGGVAAESACVGCL